VSNPLAANIDLDRIDTPAAKKLFAAIIDRSITLTESPSLAALIDWSAVELNR